MLALDDYISDQIQTTLSAWWSVIQHWIQRGHAVVAAFTLHPTYFSFIKKLLIFLSLFYCGRSSKSGGTGSGSGSSSVAE